MDRQVSELRKNEAMRQELKRDVFGKALGHQAAGGYLRVYVEDEDGTFECVRSDPARPNSPDVGLGQIAPRAYLDTLRGTWVFIEEPTS